jgi:hypothetical protein
MVMRKQVLLAASLTGVIALTGAMANAAPVYDLSVSDPSFSGTGMIAFMTPTGTDTTGVSLFSFDLVSPDPFSFGLADVTEVSWDTTGGGLDVSLRAVSGSFGAVGETLWELVLNNSQDFTICDDQSMIRVNSAVCKVEQTANGVFSSTYEGSLTAVPSVPAPAALPLLLGALFAFGVAARRHPAGRRAIS